jgi:hypothetical protein
MSCLPEPIHDAADVALPVADLLVVAGLPFDPRPGEEARELGRLTVPQVRISPDLLVGRQSTGAGNLFQVLGDQVMQVVVT